MSAPDGEIVDSGTGTEGVSSSPVETTQESGMNPAWKEMLDVLPKEFIPLVTPHLQKWDSNYQSLAQQHAPYKEFGSPEELRAYKQLAENLNNNPKMIYDRLGELLGITPQQAAAVAKQATATEVDDEEIIDPNVKALKEQQDKLTADQQKILAYVESQQSATAEAQYSNRIEAKMQAMTVADPNLDKGVLMQFVNNIAIGDGFKKEPEAYMDEAYASLKKFEQNVASRYAAGRPSAPNVINPTGGMPPANITDPAKMDVNQKAELFKLRLQQLGG